jgi:uncharacterized protein
MSQRFDRAVSFVLKVSKLCNLRCKYCYEMKELDQPTTLSHAQLRYIYENIRNAYVKRDREEGRRTEVRFIWHGGEPLLIDPEFYWTTFREQAEIFGSDLSVENSVQTNLTVLDERRIELLQRGFHSFGVSVDLVGGLRVNIAGRDQQKRVLQNMETLRRRGLNFGGITVLSKRNLPHIEQIFRFYERAGMGFRILPLFPGAFNDQHAGYDITTDEIVSACTTLLDLWFQSATPPDILPLSGYAKSMMRRPDRTPLRFNKREWDPALLVNITGDLYHTTDPYADPEWSLGNILTTPLSKIAASSQMEKSLRVADERMAANCNSCRFLGRCSGYPIVEEEMNTREQLDGVRRCVVEKRIFEHIERRISQNESILQRHLDSDRFAGASSLDSAS